MNIEVPPGFHKFISLHVSSDQMKIPGEKAQVATDDVNIFSVEGENGLFQLDRSFRKLKIDIPTDSLHQATVAFVICSSFIFWLDLG